MTDPRGWFASPQVRGSPTRSVALPVMSARIAVIGTGYVGLTTGVCLAELGHTVVCADIDADKVARLSAGELPIVEDGLDKLLASGLDSGRLSFVVGAAAAVADCEIAFLCVPTPQRSDGSADLSYIEAASAEIGPVLPSGGPLCRRRCRRKPRCVRVRPGRPRW